MRASELFVEWSFRLSLATKALLGLAQLAGGIGLVASSAQAVVAFVDWMARNELAEDPHDLVFSTVVGWASHLSASSEHFYAFYLVAHGVLNLGVALALLFGLRGAYRVSLVVLAGFVVYQLLRFAGSHDPVLLVLTAIDLFVIALVLLEHRQARRQGRG